MEKWKMKKGEKGKLPDYPGTLKSGQGSKKFSSVRFGFCKGGCS
jgi:hypothetical protein